MLRKKSILINSLGGGGAERQVSNLCKLLKIDNLYLIDNIQFYEVPKRTSIIILEKFRKNRLLNIIYGVFKLREIISKQEIIISFMEQSNFINILLKLLFKDHIAIISIRISPLYYSKKKFGSIIIFCMKFFYSFADKVVCNSIECLEYVEEKIFIDPQRLHYIPNGVDTSNLRLNNNPNEKERCLITVGRITDQKNISFQIKILSQLRKMGINIKLKIIGQGPQLEYLKKLSESLGLKVSNKLNADVDIMFLGTHANPFELAPVGSIFLLTSLFEGMPNVLLEALSLGLPVAASDCPTGPREILGRNYFNERLMDINQFGLLFKQEDENISVKKWASALKDLLESDDLYEFYSRQSLTRSKDFELVNVARQWSEIIEN